MQASGGAVLNDDGSNLIQVLNDLSSSRGRVFDRIVATASSIIPEMDDVLAGLQAGTTAVDLTRVKLAGLSLVGANLSHVNLAGKDLSGTRLVGAMQTFIAMYRPHAAREDTDLFPKLRRLVSSNEYDAMAEEFEKKEHELFGEDGFDKMADRVAQMEQRIGIHDLNQFTPH